MYFCRKIYSDLERLASLAAAVAAAVTTSPPHPPHPPLAQAVAVLAAEVRLRGKGRVGALDLGQSALGLLAVVPFEA